MTNPSPESFPYLDTLIGGWFHQDFDLAGDTLEEIVAAFTKVSPEDDRRGTKADIQRFLRTRDEEQVARDFVEIFQPGVDPTGWGMTTKRWLETIDELLGPRP